MTGEGLTKKGNIKILALVFAFLCVTNQAFAHMRKYVWTEIYQTLPQGGRELEYWTTLNVPNGNRTNENTWQYQSELEYGITGHWTIAHYESWKTTNQSGEGKDFTNYRGFKFENKYRIGEKGQYWMDPLVYVEWATDPRNHPHENEIEAKVVLSKDLGKFNVSYNQIIESELGRGGRTEHNYSVGAGYEVADGIRVGGEFFGNYWKPGSHRNEMSLGPTVSYEGNYFWVAAGGAWAVNKNTDDVQARVIVGIPF